ncbi:MAG: hypothetical protein C4518_09540 [Desulfobacteraceae bacterium]|nr:MAG: hypothetical protein C4518_09540 [Desulfobacteraceae bacterium]
METCLLNDFLAVVRPWIDSQYIRNARMDKDGLLVLNFVDGVQNVYRIDDCNQSQLAAVLEELHQKGVTVIK